MQKNESIFMLGKNDILENPTAFIRRISRSSHGNRTRFIAMLALRANPCVIPLNFLVDFNLRGIEFIKEQSIETLDSRQGDVGLTTFEYIAADIYPRHFQSSSLRFMDGYRPRMNQRDLLDRDPGHGLAFDLESWNSSRYTGPESYQRQRSGESNNHPLRPI